MSKQTPFVWRVTVVMPGASDPLKVLHQTLERTCDSHKQALMLACAAMDKMPAITEARIFREEVPQTPFEVCLDDLPEVVLPEVLWTDEDEACFKAMREEFEEWSKDFELRCADLWQAPGEAPRQRQKKGGQKKGGTA